MGNGWGPLSVVAINGNVGIGMNSPSANRLAILQQLGSDDIKIISTIFSSKLQRARSSATRSIGIGLLNNGARVAGQRSERRLQRSASIDLKRWHRSAAA
jgi:hypothetical protein